MAAWGCVMPLEQYRSILRQVITSVIVPALAEQIELGLRIRSYEIRNKALTFLIR